MEVLYQEMYKMERVEARRKLLKTHEATGSIRKTALLWGTSRTLVRKWVRRYQKMGEKGLEDVSKKPHHSPFRTPYSIEQKVLKIRKEREYGKRRIAYFLVVEEGFEMSEYTIRNILKAPWM